VSFCDIGPIPPIALDLASAIEQRKLLDQLRLDCPWVSLVIWNSSMVPVVFTALSVAL
jgi:hypothetical protein